MQINAMSLPTAVGLSYMNVRRDDEERESDYFEEKEQKRCNMTSIGRGSHRDNYRLTCSGDGTDGKDGKFEIHDYCCC
jgi:hypothetical protein